MSVPVDDNVTEQVAKQIRSGKADLAKVTEAIRAVITTATATVQWRFHPEQIEVLRDAGKLGGPVQASDLTVGEQVYIMDQTNLDWSHFDPRVDQKAALVFMTALIAHRNPEVGRDYDKARAIAEQVTTGEFDDAYSIVEQRPADPT